MFKTLAILAVSMTATTVLLINLEPVASRAIPHPNPEQLRQVVHFAVAGMGPIRSDSWRGVEIVLEREVAVYRSDALAAVRAIGEHHFRIGNAGEVSSSPAWREQKPASSSGAVRIVLAEPVPGAPVSPLQYTALRMLLEELKGVFGPSLAADAMAWWVRLSDEAAMDAALGARLRSEGLLG